jgi:hypothetical protein
MQKLKGILIFMLLLFWAGSVSAYVYEGYHWPDPNPMNEVYLINPNCADPEAGTPDDQIVAIKAGARAWVNEGNANFVLNYGGTCSALYPNDSTTNPANGYNEIMFVQDPAYWYFAQNPSVIAVVWTWSQEVTPPPPVHRHVYEADMAWNDHDFVFNGVGDPTTLEHDIWNIAAHEFGHFLKLNHPPYTEATMYLYSSKGETKKRDLYSDDVAGIQYIYGIAPNTNPVLSNPQVLPNLYDPGPFSFNYYVDYYDANSNAPSIANVYIDGTPHTMTLDSGTPSQGTYKYTTGLPAFTNHTYSFYFEDGNNGSDILPVLGTFSGPATYKPNRTYY